MRARRARVQTRHDALIRTVPVNAGITRTHEHPAENGALQMYLDDLFHHSYQTPREREREVLFHHSYQTPREREREVLFTVLIFGTFRAVNHWVCSLCIAFGCSWHMSATRRRARIQYSQNLQIIFIFIILFTEREVLFDVCSFTWGGRRL